MSTLSLKQKIRYTTTLVTNAVTTFKEDVRGISGIEFAMIAPMLIGVYLGVAETSLGVTNGRKVSRVAATLADLVSQTENITASQVDGIMNASSAVMAPFSSSDLSIFVVGVQIDNHRRTRVVWSKGRNGAPPAVGTAYPIPNDIKIAGTFLIVTNVTYDYNPSLGGNLVGTIHFNEKNYNVPRTSSTIGYDANG
jgi:Flp pilus assembly protein TadG